eukprot:Phypoly_transcript_14419.p1 GENE.Phypoly_transcript_14419~~Phypoly_transcript_14419.p1  ORF type:complete len:106 (+),score=13.46 Phypoly_transcript_14419:37-354(+)
MFDVLAAKMHEVDVYSEVISPPPLFTPHVLLPNAKETKTYGESGYLEDSLCIEPYMVDNREAVSYSFEYARQYDYNIAWVRDLDIAGIIFPCFFQQQLLSLPFVI